MILCEAPPVSKAQCAYQGVDRPHWSFSQLNQFLRCPLQYWFERVLRLERPFAASAMVLGSAVHESLAEYHRRLQENQSDAAKCLQETFLHAWKMNEERQPIQFRESETKEGVLAMGIALLELYAQESPPENIVGVEEAMLVPLFTSSGDCLEKPLMAIIDLLHRDSQGLVVTEFKTSGRRFSELETDMLLQATAYGHAVYEHYDEKPGIRYCILVKTKKPTVQYLETVRSDSDMLRLGDVTQAVEKAIEAGAFYPVESTMNCSGCPFYRQCREWRGCQGHHAEAQSEEMAAC